VLARQPVNAIVMATASLVAITPRITALPVAYFPLYPATGSVEKDIWLWYTVHYTR
jgi:hypothetical protein